MPKRRANGEGNIRKRKDGRWEGRYTAGHDPETGKATRMTLLLFFDGASNHPLGWEIMPTENTDCISAAFRRTCLVLGKFPRVVYLDNGRAFRAKFFKGCPDFEQAGFLGLYKDLGCEVIHAWPYHGQS